MPDIVQLTNRDTACGVQQQVVGAVIERDGHVLLLHRYENDFRGGTWELPSGKVEPGEDLITALRREVAEETGLEVAEITSYLGAFDYMSGSGRRTRQHTWSVTAQNTEPVRLSEHDACAWSGDSTAYPVSPEVKSLIETYLRSGLPSC